MMLLTSLRIDGILKRKFQNEFVHHLKSATESLDQAMGFMVLRIGISSCSPVERMSIVPDYSRAE